MKQRLYRYLANTKEGKVSGITWNTNKVNVINDVKSNFINAKHIIVVWLKEGTMEYNLALIERK